MICVCCDAATKTRSVILMLSLGPLDLAHLFLDGAFVQLEVQIHCMAVT